MNLFISSLGERRLSRLNRGALDYEALLDVLDGLLLGRAVVGEGTHYEIVKSLVGEVGHLHFFIP